jgi:hypothetical protein
VDARPELGDLVDGLGRLGAGVVAVGAVEGEESGGDGLVALRAGALEEVPAPGRVGREKRAEVGRDVPGGDGRWGADLGRDVGVVGERAVLADGVLEQGVDLSAKRVERLGEGVRRAGSQAHRSERLRLVRVSKRTQ